MSPESPFIPQLLARLSLDRRCGWRNGHGNQGRWQRPFFPTSQWREKRAVWWELAGPETNRIDSAGDRKKKKTSGVDQG